MGQNTRILLAAILIVASLAVCGSETAGDPRKEERTQARRVFIKEKLSGLRESLQKQNHSEAVRVRLAPLLNRLGEYETDFEALRREMDRDNGELEKFVAFNALIGEIHRSLLDAPLLFRLLP